jgi:hypothetical protein
MPLPQRSSSFDDLESALYGDTPPPPPRPQPPPPHAEALMSQTADSELRDMVALMPGRNEARMFRDEPARPSKRGSIRVAGGSEYLQRSPAKKGIARPAPSSAPTTGTDFFSDGGVWQRGDENDVRGTAAAANASVTPGDTDDVNSASYEYYYSSEAGAETRDGFVEPDDDVDDSSLPRLPSFRIRGVSSGKQNVADAVVTVLNRFVTEDLSTILAILRRRFSQLVPHVQRFVAHIMAFWGGITYMRRALAALLRILKKDKRVRELLERIAWNSASTLRLFLSMATMTLQTVIRVYSIIRYKFLPEARRLLPRYYSNAIHTLLRVAAKSPWILILGPMSLQFALQKAKLPDPNWLYRVFRLSPSPSRVTNGTKPTLRPGTEAAATMGTSLDYTYEYTYASGSALDDRNISEPPATSQDTGSYYYTYGTASTAAAVSRHGNVRSMANRYSTGKADKIRPHSYRGLGKENATHHQPGITRALDYSAGGKAMDD